MAKINIDDIAIDAATLEGKDSSKYFQNRQSLAAEDYSDLNDIIRSGCYAYDFSSNSPKNAPSVYPFGLLLVFSYFWNTRALQVIIPLLNSADYYLIRTYDNNLKWSEWQKVSSINTANISNDMIQKNVIEHMGGGITPFIIGDYAVTVRQKGGQRNGKSKHRGFGSSISLQSRNDYKGCGYPNSERALPYERLHGEFATVGCRVFEGWPFDEPRLGRQCHKTDILPLEVGKRLLTFKIIRNVGKVGENLIGQSCRKEVVA